MRSSQCSSFFMCYCQFSILVSMFLFFSASFTFRFGRFNRIFCMSIGQHNLVHSCCILYLYYFPWLYRYILTFLDHKSFSALPILHKTQVFLYPMTFLFITWVATVTAGWNISQSAMGFYHYRAESHNLHWHAGNYCDSFWANWVFFVQLAMRGVFLQH